jgi:hypothetical protein
MECVRLTAEPQDEGLRADKYVSEHTTGFPAKNLKKYSPAALF